VKFGPEGFKFQTAADRHCERSEAIQLSFLLPGGLLRLAVMPEARITLRPAGGMKMIVTPR